MRATVLSLFLAVLPAAAQVHDEVALTRAEIQTERQAIVAENLHLGEADGQAFWPMYREYRNEMAKVGDRAVKLVHDYATSYETLTDDQASAMLDELFAIQKEELKVKTSWVGKFRKSFSPKTVARFFQIENKLDAIVRAEAALEIPLVVHRSHP